MKTEMKRPRVLLVTHEFPPQTGGIARFCLELARAASSYAEIDVVAPRYDLCDVPQNGKSEPFKTYRFAGAAFRYGTFLKYRAAIRARLSMPYDLVVAADWPGILALRTLDVGNARRIGIFYGTEIYGLSRSPLIKYVLRSRSALDRLDDVVCISEFTRRLLLSHFPHLEPQSRVVALGVSDYWFNSVSADAARQFRSKYGCADRNRKLVLTVARLDSRKGQDRLIRALGALPSSSRDRVEYVCIGPESEPDYVAHLKALAVANGVNFALAGRISDEEVRVAYRAADLFALTANADPVKHEGFGLVLLECAAQGLPALVTNVDAIPEVVINDVNGMVCDSDDMITAALQKLLDNDLHFSAATCINHARNYSWDTCARVFFAGFV